MRRFGCRLCFYILLSCCIIGFVFLSCIIYFAVKSTVVVCNIFELRRFEDKTMNGSHGLGSVEWEPWNGSRHQATLPNILISSEKSKSSNTE